MTVVALFALTAPAAAADHHLMTVNEVMLSSGGQSRDARFVELLDPMAEPFPNGYVPYRLGASTAAASGCAARILGNRFRSRDNTEPFVIASGAAVAGR